MTVIWSPCKQLIPRKTRDLKGKAERLLLIGEVLASAGLKAAQRLRAMLRKAREPKNGGFVQLCNSIDKCAERLRRKQAARFQAMLNMLGHATRRICKDFVEANRPLQGL